MTRASTALGTKSVRRRNPPPAGTTTITLHGGRMSNDQVFETPVELPIHASKHTIVGPIAAMPMWETDADTATMTIDDVTIELTPATRAYVFNWDDAEPTIDALYDGNMDPKPFQDDDFKWVYDLLAPPAGATWKQWIGEDGFLPAPRTVDYLAATGKPVPSLFASGSTAAPALAGVGAHAKNMMNPGMHAPGPNAPSVGQMPLLYPPISTCDSARWRGPATT